MKQKLLGAMLIVFFAATTALSQTTGPVMTNANVVKLVKGKMDNDIILSKIETSACKFDVSDDALMSLKSSGVPTDIIKAMIEKTNGKKAEPKAEPAAPGSSAKETGLEPATLNEVYYVDAASHSLKSLEKGKAAMVQKGNVLTGKVQSNFELKGAKSSVRVSSQDDIAFTVDMSYGDPTGFELYKTEVKGGKRIGRWVSTSAYSGKSSAGESIVPVTASRPNGKAFKMVPAKLEKGEYFFLSRLNSLSSAGQSYDVFAFGVD